MCSAESLVKSDAASERFEGCHYLHPQRESLFVSNTSLQSLATVTKSGLHLSGKLGGQLPHLVPVEIKFCICAFPCPIPFQGYGLFLRTHRLDNTASVVLCAECLRLHVFAYCPM